MSDTETNSPKNIGIIALLAVAVTAGGIALLTEEQAKSSEKAGEASRESVILEPSKLITLEDGSRVYARKRVTFTDPTDEKPLGEVKEELITLDAPDCVRRPRGAKVSDCMRRVQNPSGAFEEVDPGELNRFSAEQAVGAGCVAVACSVVADGSNPDEDEVLNKSQEAKK